MLYSLAIVIGATIFAALSGMAGPLDSDAAPDVQTVPVTRGTFRAVVTERGTIDSARNVTITNAVEWSTTIVGLIPEGTRVKKGDVVCRLDSSELEQRAKERKVRLIQADARVQQAEENVHIRELLNQRNIARAELQLKLAGLDLQKFREGEFSQQVDKLRGDIKLAETDLTRARERYEYTKRVSKKGYSTYNDLEDARIAMQSAQIKSDIAQGKLKVLKDFTYEREIKELQANAKELERELERVRQTATISLLQAKIALTSRRRSAQIHRALYERYLRNIENCTVRAPQAGEVVYAVNRRSRSSQFIEEGASVRFRQPLIKLPDLEHMQVEAKIHESQIRHVSEGQPVTVRVSAVPDVVFRGTVQSISTVPSAYDAYRYRQKNYEARIRLDGEESDVTRLRPGMTALVEFEVDRRENVLQVPEQSVVEVDGKHVAYVLTERGPEPREVLVGGSNTSDVEIISGLEEGEAVLVDPAVSDER